MSSLSNIVAPDDKRTRIVRQTTYPRLFPTFYHSSKSASTTIIDLHCYGEHKEWSLSSAPVHNVNPNLASFPKSNQRPCLNNIELVTHPVYQIMCLRRTNGHPRVHVNELDYLKAFTLQLGLDPSTQSVLLFLFRITPFRLCIIPRALGIIISTLLSS